MTKKEYIKDEYDVIVNWYNRIDTRELPIIRKHLLEIEAVANSIYENAADLCAVLASNADRFRNNLKQVGLFDGSEKKLNKEADRYVYLINNLFIIKPFSISHILNTNKGKNSFDISPLTEMLKSGTLKEIFFEGKMYTEPRRIKNSVPQSEKDNIPTHVTIYNTEDTTSPLYRYFDVSIKGKAVQFAKNISHDCGEIDRTNKIIEIINSLLNNNYETSFLALPEDKDGRDILNSLIGKCEKVIDIDDNKNITKK